MQRTTSGSEKMGRAVGDRGSLKSFFFRTRIQGKDGATVRPTEYIKLGVSAVDRMLLGANLASLSLLAHPRRMLNYVSECLDLHKMVTSRGLPQKHVYEVLRTDDVTSITLDTNPNRPNAFGDDYICLFLICRLLQPKLIFEIGTAQGYSAFHFALNTPPDCTIYTLDLPKDSAARTHLTHADRQISEIYSPDNGGYYFENTDVASKINLLFGDSANFDYSEFYGKVDFFFVDGSHSYEYVQSDTLNAMKCCHPGSIIAWHDFGRVGVGVEGVSRWLVELSKQYEIYAVPEAEVAFMKVP